MKRTVMLIVLVSLVPAQVRGQGESGTRKQLWGGATSAIGLFKFTGEGVISHATWTTRKLGFAAGGHLGYELHERVQVHGEVLLSIKGSYVDGLAGEAVPHTLTYIDVPLWVRIPAPIPGRIEPFVAVGPTVSLLLRATLEDEDGTSHVEHVLKRTDFGVLVGAGADVALAEDHVLGAEVRYNLGLYDIYDFPEAMRGAIYNRGIMLLLRYRSCIVCSRRPGARGRLDVSAPAPHQESELTGADGQAPQRLQRRQGRDDVGEAGRSHEPEEQQESRAGKHPGVTTGD